MSSPSVLVVDGHSLAYRAFFGLPLSLTLPNGKPINAVFGFMSIFLKALEKFQPQYVVVCFDRKDPTFRHTMFQDYKGHRDPPPDDFISQLPVLNNLLETLSIPVFSVSGFEADDLMGTLAKHAEDKEVSCLLMTGDTDAYQLVSPFTTVVQNKNSEILMVTPEFVHDKYGLTPGQMIDFKALKGDASDNIPGVKGVGEKTALKLLYDYPSLDDIYANLNAIKSNSVKTKLETDKEKAYLSYDLVKIRTDVPLPKPLDDCAYQPDWSQILTAFKDLQFTNLITKYQHKLQTPVPELAPQPPKGDYRTVDTLAALNALLPKLKKGFAFDVETTQLDPIHAQLVGLSISWEANQGIYVPFNKYLTPIASETQASLFQLDPTPNQTDPFQRNPLLDCLVPILEDPTIPKTTHHGKYEILVLQNYQVALKGIAFDTLLAAYLLHPQDALGLKALAKRYLNMDMTTFKEVAGTSPFQDVPIDQATAYAAADSDMTFQLAQLFAPKLSEKGLMDLFEDIEMPLQPILAAMEREGVCLNTPYLNQLESEFHTQTTTLAETITQAAGTAINLNSPKQVAELFFDKLGLPVQKKTKTGRSTDSSVLEALAPEHPIAAHLLEYRQLEKLQSTYIRALPRLVSPITHRIHTSFNQTITQTGRLSSSNPNLQNIPIRSQEGRKIRAAFIPRAPKRKLISADYSQIELRLVAHFADDAHMIQAFHNGEDIHQSTAAKVFDTPLDEVTTEQRRQAKAVNFGILYGQSAFGLSNQLGVSNKDAQAIIDQYFQAFSSIQAFMAQVVQDVQETKYVRTAFNRIRYIPDIDNRVPHKRKMAERIAINTRVQGTAADIMKIAMLNVYNELQKQELDAALIIQVHDELVLDVADTDLDAVSALVQQGMESVVSYKVPLSTNLTVSPTWL